MSCRSSSRSLWGWGRTWPMFWSWSQTAEPRTTCCLPPESPALSVSQRHHQPSNVCLECSCSSMSSLGRLESVCPRRRQCPGGGSFPRRPGWAEQDRGSHQLQEHFLLADVWRLPFHREGIHQNHLQWGAPVRVQAARWGNTGNRGNKSSIRRHFKQHLILLYALGDWTWLCTC